MIVGNGEHVWYLSQVKGPAEDDLVDGNISLFDCLLGVRTTFYLFSFVLMVAFALPGDIYFYIWH